MIISSIQPRQRKEREEMRKRVISRKKTDNYAEIEIRVEDDATRKYLLEAIKKAIRRWNRSHENKISYEIISSSKDNC